MKKETEAKEKVLNEIRGLIKKTFVSESDDKIISLTFELFD